MKTQEKSISGLYYNYKKVSDDEIRDFLEKVLIVYPETRKNEEGYYEIVEKNLKKVIESPREFGITFEREAYRKIEGLAPYLRFNYLVKSSSRFFLKGDIGEIFDQLPYYEKYNKKLKAILIEEEYQLLPDTEGEHFIMWATLLTNIENISKDDSDSE